VLDTASPHGIAWRSGIDRLITDITPELAGDLDCNSFDLTSVGNIGFSAVTGTLAGIQNQNLLDKSATETVAGAWTYGSNIAMGTNKITGLGDPTAAQDASTKTYTDTQHLGYLCSSGVWAGGALGGTLGAGANFMPITAITGWTLHAPNNGWTETNSEFAYTGGTKTFLVQYTMHLQFYATGAGAATVGLVNKITKKPSGSSYADVPGSFEMSEVNEYLTWGGAYFHLHSVSGSCIVSVEEGDTIAFNFGTFAWSAYIPVAYATTAGTEGATITITPIG